jgi:iron complex transport system ATP-binding protein
MSPLLAATYCHRLYLLAGGQIVAQGTPEKALTPEIIQQVFHVRAAIGKHPLTGGMQLSLIPLPEVSSLQRDETVRTMRKQTR